MCWSVMTAPLLIRSSDYLHSTMQPPDNIYKIMLNFGKLYDIISDEEKKSLITYLIKEIQIYPNGESEMPLKSIEFNFPIYIDGKEVRRLLWESGNTVETVALMSRTEKDISVLNRRGNYGF